MKIKLLITLTSLSMLVSCGPNNVAPHDSCADARDKSTKPIKSDKSPIGLEVLGIYDVTGGNLYVYRFGNDTIYWVEGRSSSYPVALQVK